MDDNREMEPGARRYAAFISYRHLPEDRQWAKWLLSNLENFRTPGVLVKRGFRRRIGLLYRDEDENPASAELSEQIQRALAASDALIVVASRATPESRWIRQEIETFQKLGKGDRILVLLVDGEPASAFPPALLGDGDREPIAADVRERPDESQRSLKRRARLRLAAALLGCAFDDLYRRDRQRRIRRLQLLTLGLVATISAALVGWLFITRDVEIGSVEALAAQVAAQPYTPASQKAAVVFRALPMMDWRMIGLPPNAAKVIGPVARLGAVRTVDLPGALGAPTTISEAQGRVGIGTDAGAVLQLRGNGVQVLVPPAGCKDREAYLKHCAITVLAAQGNDIAAGTLRGEVLVIRNGVRKIAAPLSRYRIETLLWLPGEQLLATDATGSIFRIRMNGQTEQVGAGGGSVARILVSPEGKRIVLRIGGRIETLSDDGRLALLHTSPRAIRDGGWIRGELVTVEMSKAGPFSPDHDSVVVLYREQGSRVFPFSGVEQTGLPTSFGDGVRFRQGKDTLFAGNGTDIREVDPFQEKSRSLGIAVPDAALEDREMTFFFRGALVESEDGARLYSISERKVAIIDQHRLAEINTALASRFHARSKLCGLLGKNLFMGKNIPGNPC